MFILLWALLGQSDKIIETRYSDIAPKIDGFIEEIWQQADSANDFIQFKPYEKGIPTDTTVVYLLQDKNNLYVAYRCHCRQNKPTVYPGLYEDYVVLYLDPMASKNTAYFFQTTISGVIEDGMMLDNGLNTDASWDGVWYRGVKIYDDRYEVEIKIPFKSIRYKKELSEWGVNFARYTAAIRETDYWTEVLLTEQFLISKFGALKCVEPRSTGYYFELYPEAYVRYNTISDDEEIKPSGSLNFKWDATPQTTVNATVLPDFAQIESDPYALNLSQYPVYLSERRPFFIEGFDIFRMPSLGLFSIVSLLKVFYSRRIGKSMGDESVPILGGIKLTTKSEKFNAGVFGAYTDEYRDTSNTIIEPARTFGVFRAKQRMPGNIDLGTLFNGMYANQDDYNYVVDVDGVLNNPVGKMIFQAAVSDRNRKRDWAASMGYSAMYKRLLMTSHCELVGDSFDVSEIGYVPWSGRKRIDTYNPFWWTYSEGFVRDWTIGPGGYIVQEPGSNDWSKVIYLATWPSFRNGQELLCRIAGGPYYEADTNYLLRYMYFETWQSGSKNWWGTYLSCSYRYNYSRNILAYQSMNEFWGGYRVIPSLSPEIESYLWVEWDTTNSILAMTLVMTPEITYSVSRDIELRIFDEIVALIPETHVADIALSSNRLGFLFSWNFLPKSWFYIAVNDYRERVDERLQSKYFISAIKVKYLFYF
ncbi:MAG TPA: DUF5916 domain-containing protein [bacterium]